MESLFATLAAAGIDRDGLVRAWDFTTASETNLTERMLAIRNDAFKQLGDTNLADLTVQGSSPKFTVTKVTDNPNAEDRADRGGHGDGAVLPRRTRLPERLALPLPARQHARAAGAAADPGQHDRRRASAASSRRSAANGGARASLYGHGLFGSRGEVEQGQLEDMASEHNFVFCATEWIGMACSDVPDPTRPAGTARRRCSRGNLPQSPDCDVPNVVTILHDLSNFPTLADRVQQGMLDFMYLGRAMIHPHGLGTDPAFQDGTATRSSTAPSGCSTTATARAGSSAAR